MALSILQKANQGAQPSTPDTSVPAPTPQTPEFATPANTPPTLAEPAFKSGNAPTLPGYQPKGQEGFFEGLIFGQDPNKQQTIRSIVGSSLTDFIRSGVDAGAELFSPQRQAVRANLDNIRKTDPNTADQIEAEIGKAHTAGQNVVRLGASLGEAALTLLPIHWLGAIGKGVVEGAKVAETGVEATKAASVLDRVSAPLTKIPGVTSALAKHMTTGFAFGSSYSFLHGLESDANLTEALKEGAIGGTIGLGLPLAGTLAMKSAGATAEGLARFTQIARDVMPQALNPSKFIEAHVPVDVYKNIFSVGSTISKYYGDVGRNFIKMYNEVGAAASVDVGKYLLKFTEAGLIKPPAFARRLAAGVEYVGDNSVFTNEANRVLRGLGPYSDPVLRQQAIQSDERLMLMDVTRRNIGSMAQQESGVSLLDPETYLPKHTPVVPLKGAVAREIEQTSDPIVRAELYAKNDPVVKDMVENSVYNEKKYTSLDEAYKEYYAYADMVGKGGRLGLTKNDFLLGMVKRGEASSVTEARGKVIRDMSYRQQTLTPRASSLDFKREADLPWYDPNPTRVLPVYVADMLTRLHMSRTFGKDDEVIKEMLGKIQDSAVDGVDRAKTFDGLIRIVTNQVARNDKNEAASAWFRALNVLKLSTSAILQVGQHLNTLLSSDFPALGKGLKTIFSDEGMRQAVASGSMTNAFIREMHAYSSGGYKFADRFLTATGMTHADLFNRAVAANTGKFYAESELARLMKKIGATGATDTEKAQVSGWVKQKEQLGEAISNEGLKVQKQIAEQWNKEFPNADLQLRAGDMEAATKTLDSLDKEASKNIGTLQKTKKDLEAALLAETKPLTGDQFQEMTDRIKSLRAELRARTPVDPQAAPAVEAPAAPSADQFDAAVEAGMKLQQDKLQSIISHLEESLADAPDVPGGEAVQSAARVARPTQTTEQKIARLHSDIQTVDAEILRLTNEVGGKTRLLQGMVDSYKIAGEKMASKFPGAAKYDALIADKKAANAPLFDAAANRKRGITDFASVNTPEIDRLAELGINPEEAVARGFLTRDDHLNAGFNLSSKTQFLSRSSDLPAFANSPFGKVVSQFRTFAYQQGTFLKSEIYDDLAGRGDFKRGVRNLLIFTTLFPISGEVIADVRSLITGTKRPTDALGRYFDNIISVGGMGLAFDALRGAQQGRLSEFLLGPGIGETVRTGENVIGLNGKALLKQGLGATGLTPIRNRIPGFEPAGGGETFAETLNKFVNE